MPGGIKVSAKPKILVKNNQLFTKKEKKILTKSIKELAAQSNNSASLEALITRLSQESIQDGKTTPALKPRRSQETLTNTIDNRKEGDPVISNNNEGISTVEKKNFDIPPIEETNIIITHTFTELNENKTNETLTLSEQIFNAHQNQNLDTFNSIFIEPEQEMEKNISQHVYTESTNLKSNNIDPINSKSEELTLIASINTSPIKKPTNNNVNMEIVQENEDDFTLVS